MGERPKCVIFALVTIMLTLIDGLGWSFGCVDQEREALLLLKPFFKNLNWPVKAEENSSDCCGWKMVECNATTGRITKLSLTGGADWEANWYLNTSYFLPFEQLTSLDLGMNFISGCVKNQGFEIMSSRLRKLEFLNLGSNNFNDSIISTLSGFSSLKSLYLDANGMGATLDGNGSESLWRLSNLELLDLSNNKFNILPSLRGLSSLSYLNLAFNQLGGTIDMQELAGLRNLEELKLNNNNIEDIMVPKDKMTLNKLKVFDLGHLLISGKSIVLKSLGALSALKKINLQANLLDESNISQELFNLSGLEELSLDSSTLHKDFLQSHVGSSTSLKVLNLRSCGLKDTLPNEGWCELKNLEELDLGYNELEGTLPPCLANMSSIRILDLSYNQFTGNIASTPISNLMSIEFLSLQYNHFQVSLKPFANHSNLKTFAANDGNELIDEAASQSWTPKFQLEVLSLSNCILNTSTASFLNFIYHQFKLRYLDLSGGKFSGVFPNWLLENNTRLEVISFANNSFIGPFQFPSHSNPNMSVMDISRNKVQGQISSNISFIFPNLRGLNLSENYFHGTIPASLGELKLLTSLDLSNNQFSGELDEQQFVKSPRLLLKLSNNNLSGHIPTNLNLSSLQVLQLNGNNFVGEIPDLSSLKDLKVLDVRYNSLSGNLSRSITNMSSLEAIFLSDNQFKGHIPPELCKCYFLRILDLSGNNLFGYIPPCFSQLTYLSHLLLRRNQLRGPMTQSFLNMSSLATLDLGENNFNGPIPNWIGNLKNLGILILQGNRFHGDIPVQLCNLSSLNILDLSSNSLSGHLPSCLSHFSFTMGFQLSYPFNIGEGDNFGGYNMIISTLIGVVEFTSKRNSLNYTGYILDHMYGIDLSCNKFSGEIPLEFGNLSNLRALNLSHNSLIGSIPTSFSKLKQLESLDLSYNDLNGRIPPQLIKVNTLAVFSVAYNNLSGPLPDFKSQFGTFSNSSYEGNPLLCGPPLNNSCDETHFASPPPYPFEEESEDDGFMDMIFFWVTFVVTYTVALFGVVIVLFINSSWRHAWFYHIDLCFNTCYYFVVDKFH